MPRDAATTRQQILQAADELFYGGTFRGVSVDDIARKAGVTKKTLYYHYRSKDELFAAYIEARDRPTLERYQKWAGTDGSVANQMERLFSQLAKYIQNPAWNGCGFVRASSELAKLPGHPAVVAARAHKTRVEEWLTEALETEGHSEPHLLAKQLMVLIDGTVTQMLLHRDPEYAEAAQHTARAILKA